MSYRDEIEEAIRNFPDLPAASQRVLQVINDPSSDYTQVEEAMRYDPGLTATLLRLVNSAQFGVKQRVDSLRAAFVLLGRQKIFELVVTHLAGSTLNVQLEGYQLQPREFLRHAIWVAVATEQFAEKLELKTGEMLFTAGLLHDIGKLVMDPFLLKEQEKMQIAAEEAADESFEQREHAVFGINHNEAGGILFEHWNLPEEIADAIRYHHTPEEAPAHQQLVNIVHVADMLAYTESVGTGIEGVHYHLSDDALQSLNLEEDMIEYVASQTVDRMKEISQLLD